MPKRIWGTRANSVRAVALKPVAIIGLYGALDEPPAPLDAGAHVSKEARWVWLTHAVAILAKAVSSESISQQSQ